MTPIGDVRLITCDPGHFHAALVQKEMYPGVSPRVHVYSQLGPDLLAHLARIAGFNSRAVHPTDWQLEIHTCTDPLARLLAERPGNVVVFSGRNRGKIDAIVAALEAGLHVLADKPWVIRTEDLPRLDRALDLAEQKGLVALDIMTERWEVTTILQRALVNDPEVFGDIKPGSEARPSVSLESEHFLCKTVAGSPLRRPAWFFDVEQQGEGLSDVGTHLVDLVPWILYPDQAIARSEVEVLRARRIPTLLSQEDFTRVTGEPYFPGFLAPSILSGQLVYYCNTTALYRLRGVHVWLNIAWGFEAGPNRGDRHLAQFHGTRSTVEVRQGLEERFIPEVYVESAEGADLSAIHRAIDVRLAALADRFPGVYCEQVGGRLRLMIPDRLRVGHEAHFAEVARLFLDHVNGRSRVPAWEKAAMRAKYHITTHGVQMARASG